MNDLEVFRKRKLKKVLGRYYLPYNWTEILLFFPFLLIAIVFMPFLIYNGMFLYCLLVIIPFCFLGLLSFYRRFFVPIKTGLSFSENVAIVRDISLRQKEFSKSLEVEGLYILSFVNSSPLVGARYSDRIKYENLVVYCEENYIYTNSFSLSEVCLVRTKNAQMLEKLIKLKVLSFR